MTEPLIEHWNGRGWAQRQASTEGWTDGMLNDVSCASATFCVAVGTFGFAGQALERWNGRYWALDWSPQQADTLNGVSCPSARSCFAVGSIYVSSGTVSVIERWRGGAWSGLTAPGPPASSWPTLRSVSCPSATRCLAAGNDAGPGVYADSWDGTSWRRVAMTETGGHLGYIYEVRCLAPAHCVALAATTQVAATARSELAFWNGTRWKAIPAA